MNKHTKGNPAQLVHASRNIARGLYDIKTGKGRGIYPAIDKLFESRPDICTPDCQHRIAQPGVDVFPSLPERMAKVETKADLFISTLADIRQQYRQDDHNLERRVDDRIASVHTRIDRDVMPKLRKRIVFNTLVIVGLVVAGAINVIVLYNYFKP